MSSSDAADEGAVCMMNIGPRERRKRMRFGMVALGVGVALAAALVVLQVGRPLRLVTLLPFLAAAIGYFQAKEKT